MLNQFEQKLVGFAKSRRFLERLEILAARLLRFAGLPQQAGKVVVCSAAGSVSSSKARARYEEMASSRSPVVPRHRESTVRGWYKRIDGQLAASILGQITPVARCLGNLHQPQVGRACVTIPHRQLLEYFCLRPPHQTVACKRLPTANTRCQRRRTRDKWPSSFPEHPVLLSTCPPRPILPPTASSPKNSWDVVRAMP